MTPQSDDLKRLAEARGDGMSKVALVDIGCIECGEPSKFLGLFDTMEEAEKVKDEYLTGEPNKYGTDWGRKEWKGQHSVEMFDSETGEEL